MWSCRNARKYSSWIVCHGKKYDFNLSLKVSGSKLVLELNQGGELPLDYFGCMETFGLELEDPEMLDEVKKIIYRFVRGRR